MLIKFILIIFLILLLFLPEVLFFIKNKIFPVNYLQLIAAIIAFVALTYLALYENDLSFYFVLIINAFYSLFFLKSRFKVINKG